MGNCSFDQKTLHAQLLELLREFRRFGMTEAGGVTRLAASDEEKEARDHFKDVGENSFRKLFRDRVWSKTPTLVRTGI